VGGVAVDEVVGSERDELFFTKRMGRLAAGLALGATLAGHPVHAEPPRAGAAYTQVVPPHNEMPVSAADRSQQALMRRGWHLRGNVAGGWRSGSTHPRHRPGAHDNGDRGLSHRGPSR